MNINAQKCYQD